MKYARRIGAGIALVGLVVFFACQRVSHANVAVQGGDLGSGADPIKTVTVMNTQDTLVTAIPVNAVVLGVKIIALTTSSACGWYDAAATSSTITATGAANAGPSTMKEEMYEATTGAMDIQMWPKPWRVVNGVVVIAKSAICITYYQ